ncbi:helix-turn-helix domain-containing protein [Lentzea sp. NEAU-D13]|uniref:Helix-turn-helix domain-containing protein n=1 Tax=Lentzea alba TaxID=2714351 RepID=A0A7C9RM52_9PSEU|nr:helix-turn-helix transcriptional regulator [Lentzea alba]NGY57607.1 helix-turn-helix domain-containing protein [Lentzea alba]
MPKDFRATALERAVGRTLAGWRNELGLSLTEAAGRVGFSGAKLSMMENAMQPSAPVDIMALGYVYKVPTTEWQFAISQSQHAAGLRAITRPEPEIFDPAADLPHLVADATLLRTFTTDMVPSVFQLVGYTDAACGGDPVKAAMMARLRETWASRSDGNDPLTVEAVFTEAVLRQVVGGPRLMKAQLLRLMEVTEQPNVSLRVVPWTLPAMGPPFTWLSFPHRQHNDVVYHETFLRSEYVEEPAKIEQVSQRFMALRDLALSDGESMELIAEAAADVS